MNTCEGVPPWAPYRFNILSVTLPHKAGQLCFRVLLYTTGLSS